MERDILQCDWAAAPVVSRRAMLARLLRVSGSPCLAAVGSAWAQPAQAPIAEDPLPELPEGLRKFESAGEFFDVETDIQQLGSKRPDDAELAIGRKILEMAPLYPSTPYEIAKYFRDVGQGVAKGVDPAWRHYVRGWPEKYNPVIVDFFLSTKTRPLDPDQDGDATSWCAAFMNWCIARSRSTDRLSGTAKSPFRADELKVTTQSASSGSFRCWPLDSSPIDIGSARTGDIVVWAVKGSVQQCKFGQGHVAFLESDANGVFTVIGGNQGELGYSAVCRKRIGRSFKRGPKDKQVDVEFHSIRRIG